MSSSVKKDEVEKFARDAPRWWDERGPFKPLHALNPARMEYIKRQICAHYDLGEKSLRALKGISVLDIGCGGGLVCEPLARMGAEVTGIDADKVAIGVAKEHAARSKLNIKYSSGAAEDIRGKYDVVTALEILEHVEDPAAFAKTCSRLVRPGGLVIFSTLNRTAKSFALGIAAAEYILRWVPKGTHDWRKFIRPSELAKHARSAGLEPQDVTGLIYNPFKKDFELSETDADVNYFMRCTRN